MRRVLLMGSLVAVGAACGPGGTSTDACKGRMAGDLVITEFLADPDGTDTGSEWIEVFNTLGTAIDLKGVSIYVKKTDGSSLKTHVIKAGKIEPRSYFVLGDVRSGALPSYINYSYEAGLGALSNSDAVIGLKCGTTITFDELQYSVAAKAAHARQLDGKVTPDGTANDDETRWCDAKTMLAGTANFGTPGQANDECDVVVPSGNCTDPGSSASRPVVPPLPGQVFFTEVMADPSAASDSLGEYLEVKSTADVDLNDMVLTVGTTARAITSTQCLRVPAGSYAVLAHETDAGVNGGIPNVVATFTAALTQGAGSVTLSVEDAGIDTANYPASVSGVAWQLDPTRSDATNNDDPSAYCASTVRYGDATTGDFGTPGAANTACMASTAGMCRDMGTSQMRAIVPPSPGSLYFTEVMADPKAVADNLGEWLELKSDGAADLNGLVLTAGSTRNTLSSPDCLAVPAGGYALLAHTASGNGGLPTLTGTFTAGLSNSSTMLSIALPDAGLIDATAYPAAVAGVAWQLSPASSSAVGNDDPMSFCRATVGYPMDGGDLGTPGGANTACPAPPNPNDCVDPGSGMTRAIVKPTSGQLVITEFMADPRGTDDTTGEYIELLANASFDLNGLVLANESTGMSPVSSQTCLPVNAGQFALFARTMDPILNGGLPTPVATFGFTLTNSGVRSVVVRSGTDTLDSFGYGTTTSGASWQLRAGLSSPSDNEDAGSVCITPSARYGHFADGGLVDGGQGDRGTPGTVNENCP